MSIRKRSLNVINFDQVKFDVWFYLLLCFNHTSIIGYSYYTSNAAKIVISHNWVKTRKQPLITLWYWQPWHSCTDCLTKWQQPVLAMFVCRDCLPVMLYCNVDTSPCIQTLCYRNTHNPLTEPASIIGFTQPRSNHPVIPVSYTHLTLPTNREV